MSATSRRNKKKAGKEYRNLAPLLHTWAGDRTWEPKEFPAFILDISMSDIPKRDEIPNQFFNVNAWTKFVNGWFYSGASASLLITRDGIDRKKALRHLSLAIHSWQPSHEHKIAAVSYLLAMWFDIEEINHVPYRGVLS